MTILDTILDSIPSLPPLPQTAQKLLRMLSDPEVETKELEEVIRYDQNITTSLLRLSNSTYYSGGNASISSVRQAVVRLGRKTVGEIIMMTTCGELLGASNEGYQLAAGELWRHSVAGAVTAEQLAQHLAGPSGKPHPAAFTAGLLHDIGKVVLDHFVQEAQGHLLEETVAEGMSFCDAERKVFGTDHAEVGARVLESWNLPEEIVMGARYHHDISGAPDGHAIVALVHVADTICLSMGLGLGIDGLLYEPDPHAMSTLKLDASRFDMLCAESLAKLSELEQWFAAP